MQPDVVTTVVAIVIICYLIGLVCKVSGKVDKWIPVIVGTAGGILGIVGWKTIAGYPADDILNAIAIGVASGLASTGANQIIKQLTKDDGEA